LCLNGYKDFSLTRKTDLSLRRHALPFVLFLLPLTLAGCHQGYSPDTYASNAAQEEAAVQRGVIIGVRPVLISANGTVGAVTGGAAGGVAGSQISGSTVVTALGAIGGGLVGGIGGTAAAHAVADTKGWEYIVQEPGDKLVSVTQTSKTALPIGLHVLVISDSLQARIVPDYTVQMAAAPTPQVAGSNATKTAAASNGSTSIEIHITPFLPDPNAAEPLPAALGSVASDPTTPSAAGPASADPAAAPMAPSSTSGAVATPEAANNKASAAGTLVAGSTATSVQVAPGASIATPPESSSSLATP